MNSIRYARIRWIVFTSYVNTIQNNWSPASSYNYIKNSLLVTLFAPYAITLSYPKASTSCSTHCKLLLLSPFLQKPSSWIAVSKSISVVLILYHILCCYIVLMFLQIFLFAISFTAGHLISHIPLSLYCLSSVTIALALTLY